MKFPVGSLPKCDRLNFRLPSLDDAVFYLQLMKDPDYIRFIADNGITSEEKAREYIKDKPLARFAQFNVGLWVVELKETGQAAGVCGLVVRDELEYPDLGYAFLEEFRGRGIAREAARAVLEHSYLDLKLEKLCAITAPDNKRSADLLKKIGFKAQGQRLLNEIGETSDYFICELGSVPTNVS
ncbi:GNAT family N-acetyltransferase [uncultured Roseibium sp.]|uniref:GNAT family N-acetyltransferase n=1 Tax=uncultured Roseibium sp. TaxID=1936171 RepID=UPI002620ABE5|nr:GNAT family N-acetyltransferase [uncultured Roseibium sp.]